VPIVVEEMRQKRIEGRQKEEISSSSQCLCILRQRPSVRRSFKVRTFKGPRVCGRDFEPVDE
jgi:hypothetical protein